MNKCLQCGEALKGRRVYDDFKDVIYHLEYYCMNPECSEFVDLVCHSCGTLLLGEYQEGILVFLCDQDCGEKNVIKSINIEKILKQPISIEERLNIIEKELNLPPLE